MKTVNEIGLSEEMVELSNRVLIVRGKVSIEQGKRIRYCISLFTSGVFASYRSWESTRKDSLLRDAGTRPTLHIRYLPDGNQSEWLTDASSRKPVEFGTEYWHHGYYRQIPPHTFNLILEYARIEVMLLAAIDAQKVGMDLIKLASLDTLYRRFDAFVQDQRKYWDNLVLSLSPS